MGTGIHGYKYYDTRAPLACGYKKYMYLLPTSIYLQYLILTRCKFTSIYLQYLILTRCKFDLGIPASTIFLTSLVENHFNCKYRFD